MGNLGCTIDRGRVDRKSDKSSISSFRLSPLEPYRKRRPSEKSYNEFILICTKRGERVERDDVKVRNKKAENERREEQNQREISCPYEGVTGSGERLFKNIKVGEVGAEMRDLQS